MENGTLICRLCLKTCESYYEPIEAATLEILNFLMLNLDLDISNEPIACESCMGNLTKCVNFKKGCLRVRDPIVLDYGDDNNVLNVEKLCPNDETRLIEPAIFSVEDEDDVPNITQMCLSDKADVVNKTDSTSVCDFCMKLITSKPCMLMKNDDVDMIVKVEKYFPELGLNVTKTSIMCASCAESLQHYLAFISSCLKVEDRIRDYSAVEGTNGKGQIELSSVLQYTTKDALQNKKDHGSPNANQTEEYCQQTKNDNFEVVVKNEDCLEIEEQDLGVEDAQTEIKVESSPCDRYKNSVPSVEQPKADATLTEKEASKITTLKCQLCTYETDHVKRLRKHSLTHRLPTCKCEVCGFETKHMTSHMLTHKDPSEVRMHKCKVCGFKTKYKRCLARHQLNHKSLAEVTMYKCDICLYHTKHKDDLQKHMRMHKSDAEVTIYKCEMCTFQTRRKTGLRIHMVTHMSSAEATFHKCEVCPFKTKHVRNLSRHMQNHQSSPKIKWYECDMCGYQTKQKGTLKAHVLTHTR